MGRMRHWACALCSFVVVLLSGCASGGPSYVSMSNAIPPLQGNACRVFFYRTDSMVGAAVQPEIRLDTQVVGRSQPGGFFYVDTLPGRHLVTSQTEVEARLEFDVEAGQTVYVASSIGFGLLVGRVQLSLTSEAAAPAYLSPLRYTGSGVVPASPSGTPPAALPPAGNPLPRGRVTMADLDALLPSQAAGGAR
jgi:hypothetical protein